MEGRATTSLHEGELEDQLLSLNRNSNNVGVRCTLLPRVCRRVATGHRRSSLRAERNPKAGGVEGRRSRGTRPSRYGVIECWRLADRRYFGKER